MSFAQHNCRGSNDVFISLFHIVKGYGISFVCVQDPPLYAGAPLRAPGYECIFRSGPKVRVVIYISLRVMVGISFVLVPTEEDVLYLRIFAKEGRLVGNGRSLGLVNVYNRVVDGGNTVPPEAAFVETNEPTLVVGDMNCHTAFTDPLRQLGQGERRRGELYMRTAALSGFNILNTPGIYTRFPDNPELHRPSVLDYALANAALLPKVSRWRDVFQRTGSDHIVIVIDINSEEVEIAAPSPDWDKITWRTEEGKPNPLIEEALKEYRSGGTGYKRISEAQNAIDDFQTSLNRLIHLVRSWAPMKKPTKWSKAWWTPEITELRRIYTAAARRVGRDGTGVGERDKAKKEYRSALNKAKRLHWDDFLANAKKNDVWTAHQFTKQRIPPKVPGGDGRTPQEIEEKIMSHFFPRNDDPISQPMPEKLDLGDGGRVTAMEISDVLLKCSKRSAPGPDQVPYGVWKGIHGINQDIIPELVNDMLEWGFHPPILKMSTGVILPKPNKQDYNDCASFRVIALMQTFSKIAERVVNSRLMDIAYKEDMYCINQTGSLPQRSTVDAVMSLQHWIKEAQFAKKKVSTIFLDVKGGFDNVDHSKLMGKLESNGRVPAYVARWIQSFLTTRKIALAYPGSPRRSHEVDKGIPQGSPLSPLLFIIYVRSLHPTGNMQEVFTSSYVDDFQITVASNTWERNARLLEDQANLIVARAQELGLSFSIAKTELMHWRKRREGGPRSDSAVRIQGHTVEPAGTLVRWLGYWLSDNGETTPHFNKRLSLAQAAFWRIQRLSMPGKGLSPYGARRLAKGILLPTLLYGAEVLVPSRTMMGKMQKFWNRVARWVTNTFYSTNVTVLSVEACLAPIDLHVEQMKTMTAIRLVTAAPENNVATAMLPITFPTKDDFRVVTNRRLAFDANKGGMRPKTWSSIATTTQQTRLPMDEVAATAVTVFPDLKIPVKPSKLTRVTPEDAESYVKAKEGVRKRIWKKWVDWDYPPYYEYRPIF